MHLFYAVPFNYGVKYFMNTRRKSSHEEVPVQKEKGPRKSDKSVDEVKIIIIMRCKLLIVTLNVKIYPFFETMECFILHLGLGAGAPG